MAYIRKRITKAGAVSTTLIEAYRDKQGRPRQRILANLHGQPTIAAALARLWVNAELLEGERNELAEELRDSSSAVLDGSGRPGALMVQFKPGMRLGAINAALAIIDREIAVLLEHLEASDEEVSAAIRTYRKALSDAACTVLGMEMTIGLKHRKAKAALRHIGRIKTRRSITNST